MSVQHGGEDVLPVEVQRRIDRICMQFEDACIEGERPQIESYLNRQLTAAERAALLRELLVLDLVYRRQRGETPRASQYQAKFPHDADVIAEVFEAPPADPAERLLPGDRVSRYVIQRQLGRGGFGTVYLARDEDLRRNVAIKIPHPHRVRTAAEVERLLQEARTVARLQHPAIVSIYDAGRMDDGTFYIVLQFIDGTSLRERMQTGGLSPRDAANLFEKIADALAEAHRQGFIHRDLEPGNILLDAKGQPHVADFGLAVHESTQVGKAGEFAGSLPYMAPEQILGRTHQMDGRADIWAMGVMLYQALTGRRPFQGETPAALADDILQRSPKPPRQIDPEIPIALERVALKCLRKEPARRYDTAGDVAQQLRRWQSPARQRLKQRVAFVLLGLLFLLPAAYLLQSHLQSTTTLRGRLDVLVWRSRWTLLDSPGCVPLRTGDQIRIEAEVNQSSYLYLVWINRDGQPSPVYPWRQGNWQDRPRSEQPVMRLRLPAGGADRVWNMQPGSPGIETVLLLARGTPLPGDFQMQRLLADLPTQGDTPSHLVAWFERGDYIIQRWNGSANLRAAPDLTQAVRINDPLTGMHRDLAARLEPYFSLVHAVSFASGAAAAN